MLTPAIFIFGLFISGCVVLFIVVTRSEFRKMSEHPEQYQTPLKTVALDAYENVKGTDHASG